MRKNEPENNEEEYVFYIEHYTWSEYRTDRVWNLAQMAADVHTGCEALILIFDMNDRFTGDTLRVINGVSEHGNPKLTVAVSALFRPTYYSSIELEFKGTYDEYVSDQKRKEKLEKEIRELLKQHVRTAFYESGNKELFDAKEYFDYDAFLQKDGIVKKDFIKLKN
ncbi:MAG: hypothetical protein HXS54_05980 [Theionarchaea archaeon]|nr:hypothetical protein [Theionarchaea archaeon]DBA34808.1 TPA_asm: hypothetical protein vir521_00014 [Caudoviricetes sp. vir521]